MTRTEVYNLCKQVAPLHGYDPVLILAVCEQESAYDHQAVRLENNFLRRYVEPLGFATTVKVLFSTSYGLMQVMGLSLYEMQFFDAPTLDVHYNKWVPHLLDQFMVDPKNQIEMGVQWLKRKQGTRTIEEGLKRYNGSSAYPPQVMRRYDKLKTIYV